MLVIPNCGSCPVAAPTATLPPSAPTPLPTPVPTATPVPGDVAFTAYMASWPRVEIPINQYTLLAILGNPPAPPPLPPEVSAQVDAATVQVLVASGATTVTGSGVVIGSDGVFTVRPEKIRLGDPAEDVAADEASATGKVEQVVYVGPDTRYIVALDVGGVLVVTQQNLRTSSMEALDAQGRPVRLIWKRHHVLSLAASEEPMGETEETTQ